MTALEILLAAVLAVSVLLNGMLAGVLVWLLTTGRIGIHRVYDAVTLTKAKS